MYTARKHQHCTTLRDFQKTGLKSYEKFGLRQIGGRQILNLSLIFEVAEGRGALGASTDLGGIVAVATGAAVSDQVGAVDDAGAVGRREVLGEAVGILLSSRVVAAGRERSAVLREDGAS